MKSLSRVIPVVGIFLLAGFVIWLLSDILAPFLLGLAIAYFLDPVADRLQRLGVGRTVATLVILSTFFLVIVGTLIIMVPLLQSQGMAFVAQLPKYVSSLQDQIAPLVERLIRQIDDSEKARIRDAMGANAGEAVRWVGRVLAGLWSGGVAFVHLLSVVFITPLVAFYLLRDWDRLVEYIRNQLPRAAKSDVVEQISEIDLALAGFVRGQALVCAALGVIYGAGLSIVGLQFGLLIGLGAGVLSFIPYFGMGTGLVVSVGLGVAQFGLTWPLAGIFGVFIVGQMAESFWLTPRLVGGQVRLHPVWIIFALLSGGAIFGFTGVLLAVPVAAATGVLVRYALARYRESGFYRGLD